LVFLIHAKISLVYKQKEIWTISIIQLTTSVY